MPTSSLTMRAMGASPAGVTLATIPRPQAGPGEVAIAVVASAVNAAEEKLIKGEFAGRFLHVKTDPLVLGWDFSGRVVALGEGVSDLAVGDLVWGHLAYSNSQRQGAYAERIVVSRDELAVKPDGVSHQVAAATATCAMTSLQAMRDLGGLGKGGKVLVIGAGGGVGAIAVGVARRLGAHVTAVCSTRDVDRVAGLGADVVIDRKRDDPLAVEGVYDVIFDTPAVHSFAACAPALKAGGAYVTTLPDLGLMTGMVRALFSSKRCYFVQVASKRADLELVGSWLADGMEVTVDSVHPVADLGAALARQQDRGRTGRVVVDVAGGWTH